MIRKILVANRGEIALRIIRACSELSICSVAIYSEADRYALHVKRADESYSLGPETLEGYLNLHRIVDLAVATGCDAIHPGYGFLSENADFARECRSHGIIFIGPSPDTIETMGSKVAARAAMQKAGIPIIPGSAENLKDVEDASTQAKQMGFPVMLKATSGGGGRGIRVCHDEKELREFFPRVQSEAKKSFADDHVFLEKLIERPRHIEVQILGDSHGNVVHLFERDCSIQRRHQKLVEVAPSPQIDQAMRTQLTDWAIQAARAVNYENAGTVEFLVDKHNNAYFLEVNTRLQVEHPITESITGIDLVQAQIQIAEGKPLPFRQENISMGGYAIEFRVNAEDPQHDFLPSFGKITRYYAPGGPGVRTDSAIYTGYEIPSYYDSLCAKLTVWALDWPSLLARSRRALIEMRMQGIKTTIPYYLNILENEDFIKAEFDTHFIDEHPELLTYSERNSPQQCAAVIAAALVALQG